MDLEKEVRGNCSMYVKKQGGQSDGGLTCAYIHR